MLDMKRSCVNLHLNIRQLVGTIFYHNKNFIVHELKVHRIEKIISNFIYLSYPLCNNIIVVII